MRNVPLSESASNTCENCNDRKCMDCVLRVVHDTCRQDCPFCCNADRLTHRPSEDALRLARLAVHVATRGALLPDEVAFYARTPLAAAYPQIRADVIAEVVAALRKAAQAEYKGRGLGERAADFIEREFVSDT